MKKSGFIDYDLANSLFSLLQKLATINNEHFKKFKLGYSQYSSLMIIGHEEGISIQDLSEAQLVDKTTAGKTVKRLEEKGLLTKKKSLADERSYLLHLTPAGKKILPSLNQAYDDCLQHSFGNFAEADKKTLMQLADKMFSNLQSK